MAVGDSREASFASCEGCPLLKPEHGGQATPDRPMCYAQYGTPGMAHGSQVRARRAGRAPRTLRQVLGAASDEARALRLGTVGDPGVLALAYLDYVFEQARAANLAVLGYTHRWRARPELAGRLLASVESDEDTHAAAAEGFRVARILPKTHTGARWTTEDGTISGIVCPAQRTKSVTCNDCRLCDASNRSGPHIGFIDHSPRRKKA